MAKNPIPVEIRILAKKHLVIVRRDRRNLARNQGCCTVRNHIWLADFDSPTIELAAFFHELGHILLYRTTKSDCMSILSREGAAWELGFGVAKAEGYEWGYHSEAYTYGRECLRSYVDGEYDDTKPRAALNRPSTSNVGPG